MISILLIFVGLSNVSVSRPRSIAGCASRVVRRPVTVVSAEPRKKTTDSERRMLKLFFGPMFDEVVGVGHERCLSDLAPGR